MANDKYGELSRRQFIGSAATGITLAAVLPAQQKDTMIGVPFARRDMVRAAWSESVCAGQRASEVPGLYARQME